MEWNIPARELIREVVKLVNDCASSTGDEFLAARQRLKERAPELLWPMALRLSAHIPQEREHGESDLFRVEDLQRGMIVRHRGSGQSYVIDGVNGSRAIAVSTVEISNPTEWIVVTPGDADG